MNQASKTEGNFVPSYLPFFFRIHNDEERSLWTSFIQSNTQLVFIDQIYSQLRDLVKLEHPQRTLSDSDYTLLIEEKLSGTPIEEYGVWVYYPWKNAVVHMLDEEEFIRVRTIRNVYKITHEEQAILRRKKIGIIGLSVGQSVAMTIALERGAGELRIADFDTLELSNLNRIRTGVHNIGLKKTEIVAREIAEIDPFIKVVCYDEGVNPSNVAVFFEEGGMLDLLIEECDSVDIKILAREEARRRGIPVIMDTSDRGMIDIERFDYDRNYPILHGLIDSNVTFEFLSGLKTSEEKLPYIIPILGADNLSVRLKASGLEVGKTITTWPQLGSDVVLGGALCANVAKRILLGESLDSGRFYVDLNQILSTIQAANISSFPKERSLKSDWLVNHVKTHGEIGGGILNEDQKQMIVTAASWAPSPGNMQQWKFVFYGDVLLIYTDKEELISFSDNLGIASTIAIGCAIENIRLYCASIGLAIIEISNDDRLDFPLIRRIQFQKKNGLTDSSGLSAYITQRRTTRTVECQPVQTDALNDYLAKIKSSNIHCRVYTDPDIMKRISEIICIGDRLRLTNKQAHSEFFDGEIRWTREEAETKRDGLDIGLFDLTNLDRTGLLLAKDPEVINFLNQIDGGSGFERISEKIFKSASGIGLFFGPSYNVQNLIEAGKQIQSMWLWSTKNAIGIYPITILPMLLSFVESDQYGFLNDRSIRKIKELQVELSSLIPELKSEKLLFLFRVSSLEEPPYRSVRKPIEQILLDI